MVGGSGLYLDAVIKGLDYFPQVSPEIRKNLTTELQEKGLKSLTELQEKEYGSHALIKGIIHSVPFQRQRQ